MRISQVIAKLTKEGFLPSVGRIRHALANGYLQPLPTKRSRGAYDFRPVHLRQLRAYFVDVGPGPRRPPYAEEFPIEGSADRLHRLARKKQQLKDRGPSERALRKQRRKAADAAISWLEGIARELESE